MTYTVLYHWLGMHWLLKLSITEIYADTVQAQKHMACSSCVQKSQKMFIDTHKYNFNNIPCESEVKVLEGASKCNYIVKIMKLK